MSDLALTPELAEAIKERYLELERTICFDGAAPGSRPNSYQQQIIDDWGKVPTQSVRAGNQSGKTALGARLAAWFLDESKPGWKRPAKWGTAPLMGLVIG